MTRTRMDKNHSPKLRRLPMHGTVYNALNVVYLYKKYDILPLPT